MENKIGNVERKDKKNKLHTKDNEFRNEMSHVEKFSDNDEKELKFSDKVKKSRYTKYPCKICTKNISYTNMSKHVRRHSEKMGPKEKKIRKKRLRKKRFKCDKCSYCTNRRADFSRHADAVHNSSRRIINNKFRKFSSTCSSIEIAFAEIDEILNDSPGSQAVCICAKKMLTLGPQIGFMTDCVAKNDNNDCLVEALEAVKEKATAIATRISDLLVHFAAVEDNAQPGGSGDDNKEILNKTVIIDTNDFIQKLATGEHSAA